MKLRNLWVLLIMLGLTGQVFAQSPVAAETRQSGLRALATTRQQRDANDRQQARAFAQQAGIPMRRELPNGRLLELQRIVPGIGPVFYLTNNIVAADTVSTDEVWPAGPAGLNLDGSGMTMAEWDGGAIYTLHPDLIGRVTQVDGATEISGHSTHVAGTLIGSGAALLDSRGMAYAALLSGVCLANAGLGAVHGFASPLGAQLPIPHGMACGAVLWQTIRANIAALTERDPGSPALPKYAEAGRILADLPSTIRDGAARVQLVDTLHDMAGALDVPGLSAFEMSAADIPAVVADSPGSSMRTNPVALTDEELTSILQQAL